MNYEEAVSHPRLRGRAGRRPHVPYGRGGAPPRPTELIRPAATHRYPAAHSGAATTTGTPPAATFPAATPAAAVAFCLHRTRRRTGIVGSAWRASGAAAVSAELRCTAGGGTAPSGGAGSGRRPGKLSAVTPSRPGRLQAVAMNARVFLCHITLTSRMLPRLSIRGCCSLVDLASSLERQGGRRIF